MNEKIKQLAEQAGFKILTDGRIIPTLDHNGECGRDLQKFAELIVRECMEQVWYTREDGINGNVSEVIKERMKQHFGVEE